MLVTEVPIGHFKATEAMKKAVLDVLDRGRLSYGPLIRQFEADWSLLHKTRHALFVNSGTSALTLAVQALKIRHEWRNGDKVLVPALTFPATINACLHNGLEPVFVDVDPETLNMCPKSLERVLDAFSGNKRQIRLRKNLGTSST